jgi:hypothetical protein
MLLVYSAVGNRILMVSGFETTEEGAKEIWRHGLS